MNMSLGGPVISVRLPVACSGH